MPQKAWSKIENACNNTSRTGFVNAEKVKTPLRRSRRAR